MLLSGKVVWAYKAVLKLIASFSNAIKSSEEKKALNSTPSPFWHYSTTMDAVEIIKSHAVDKLVASELHLVNFLGVKIRPEFFPNILSNRVGEVESIPIPANWHADIAEWASCLNAVDYARGEICDARTWLWLGVLDE